MLVESAVVVGDAVVDTTVSRLGALALTPSSSSSSETHPTVVATFHLTQLSTSSPPSADVSSTPSPPVADSHPVAPNQDDAAPRPDALSSTPPSSACDSRPDPPGYNDATIRYLINDFVESDLTDRMVDSRPTQVTDRCDRIRSFSVGADHQHVRGQEAGRWRRVRSPSSLLEEDPFQVSSLLDIFDDDDHATISHEAALHDDDHAPSQPDDNGNPVMGSDADGGSTETDGEQREYWNELWDIGQDTSAFASVLPPCELPSEIPAAENRSDGLIYFYEHTVFTPADLLPLYEPDIPLQYSFSRPQPSSPVVVTVDNVSDLERLYYDDAEEVGSATAPQTGIEIELIFTDHEFNNTQDLSLALSDNEFRILCTMSDEDNGEPPFQSSLTNTSHQGHVLSNGQRSHDSSRSHSPLPIRSRIRRKMSNQSDDGQFGPKRSRTLIEEKPSPLEVDRPGAFLHTRESSYDDRSVDFSAEPLWDEPTQYDRCHPSQANFRSRAAGLVKEYCLVAFNLLVVIWQFWISLLASLASVPYNIVCRVHCLLLQLRTSRFAFPLSRFAEFGRERLTQRKYRRGRERRYKKSKPENPSGRRQSILEASKPIITVVSCA